MINRKENGQRGRKGILAGFLVFVLCCGCGREAPSDLPVISGKDVMVRMGDHTITVDEFIFRYRVLPSDKRLSYEKAGGGGRKAVLNDLVLEKLLVLAAKDRGIDREWETELKLQAARDRVLADTLYRKAVVERVIGEGVMREYYERRPEQFQQNPRYRVLEIAVTPQKEDLITNASRDDAGNETEARAKMEFVRNALEDGEDFAELARLYSEHPAANVGGDLGYLEVEAFPPVYREAITKLKVGEVSEPIPLEDGTALLFLSEKSAGRRVPFEEARESLVNFFAKGKEDLILAEAQVLREELEAKYDVQYDDDTIEKTLSR
jgi:parvulin-like peptidyl-prolyl isomerase